MVGVLLFILKLIGILLLIVLGVLLFLLLVVLLVPIRYRAGISVADKRAVGQVCVHGLLHLIHVRLDFENAKTNLTIRLAGWKLSGGKKKKKKASVEASSERSAKTQETVGEVPEPDAETKQQKKDRELLEEAVKDPNQQEPLQQSQQKPAEEKVLQPEQKLTNETVPQPEQKPTEETVPQPEQKPTEEKVPQSEQKPLKEKAPLTEKINSVIDGLKEKWEKLQAKKNRITSLINELKSDRMRPSLELVLDSLKKILIHVLPNDGTVELKLGFENPALTGQVLGILAVLYAKMGDRLSVTPYFDRAILEGTVSVKGRIRIGTLLILIIRVILDKNIRAFIKKVKKGGK